MSEAPPARVAILSGPTATGKSALALELAQALGAEILCADSLTVYRGLDVGTAKPTAAERARVPHHLLDVRDPAESFTAGDFVREAVVALAQIAARGRPALIVGGTGFYLKALTRGMWEGPPAPPELRAELEARALEDLRTELAARDPDAAAAIPAGDRYRTVRALERARQGLEPRRAEGLGELPFFVADRADDALGPRIEARARAMVTGGLLDETRSLLALSPRPRPLEAVGYRQAADFLEGRAPAGGRSRPRDSEGLVAEIALGTRQLVKKQRTWLRGQHPEARWFPLDTQADALQTAIRTALA